MSNQQRLHFENTGLGKDHMHERSRKAQESDRGWKEAEQLGEIWVASSVKVVAVAGSPESRVTAALGVGWGRVGWSGVAGGTWDVAWTWAAGCKEECGGPPQRAVAPAAGNKQG